jgi:6-phosphogluconolactonase/glucosamine-6-phosphate isomerase/deaminase
MLKTQVFADHEAVSRHAANWIIERLRQEPPALLCLACGTTPMRTYQLLAQEGAREPSLLGKCRVIKLDEWGGLPPGDPATCEEQLRSTLFFLNAAYALRFNEYLIGDRRQAKDSPRCSVVPRLLFKQCFAGGDYLFIFDTGFFYHNLRGAKYRIFNKQNT